MEIPAVGVSSRCGPKWWMSYTVNLPDSDLQAPQAMAALLNGEGFCH